MADAQRLEVGDIRPGDHVLFVYKDTDELTAFAVPFIKDGLAQGERCLYVVDDLTFAEVTGALAAGGVHVDREVARGALVLLRAEKFHPLPPFDGPRAVERIRGRVTEAAGRFAGLRIAAEMTWAPNSGVTDATLVDYELLLDEAVAGLGPVTIACMYRRDRFAPATLQHLVRSHKKVVAADHIYAKLSGLFRDIEQKDLETVLRSARVRRVPRGGFYYRQGDRAANVYVLTRGKLKFVRTGREGRSASLGVVAPSEPFGHVTALGGIARIASAQALEDSRALCWDAEAFDQAIAAHPVIALNTIRDVAQRVEDEWDHVQAMKSGSVEGRLARLLLRLAKSMGRKTRRGLAIDLPLSGEDLAEMAGTTPYTISRILAAWRRLDIVDARRDRMLILDRAGLAAVAGIVPAATSAEKYTDS